MPHPLIRLWHQAQLCISSLAMAGGLVLAMTAHAQAQARPGAGGGIAQGPKQVGTIEMLTQEVPYIRTLPGRAVAYEAAEIRPRVSGVVEEILFTAGNLLAPGDPMFRIEDTAYRAAFASAQAAQIGAKVEAAAAQATVDRYQSLQGSAITTAALHQAEAEAAAAAARLAAVNAALDAAQLDLDRTIVTSPINGIAGLPAVSVGALVAANQSDALASVTRLDPIYIDVSESSASMLRIRNRIAAGSLERGTAIGVSLILENGEDYSQQGTVVARGNVVSSTTGTIDVRVQFANPNTMILPGQFLRVNLTLGKTRAWLVPQRATGRSTDGTLTAWIAQDNAARQVNLVANGSYNNAWVVSEGLSDGDLLIVDGLTNMRDGTEVVPVPVSIDPNGVVMDTEAAPRDVAPRKQPVAAVGN